MVPGKKPLKLKRRKITSLKKYHQLLKCVISTNLIIVNKTVTLKNIEIFVIFWLILNLKLRKTIHKLEYLILALYSE